MAYQLDMQTTTCGVRWQTEFQASSDEAAIAQAEQMLNPDSWPTSCMSIILWRDGTKRVAVFRLQPAKIVQVQP